MESSSRRESGDHWAPDERRATLRQCSGTWRLVDEQPAKVKCDGCGRVTEYRGTAGGIQPDTAADHGRLGAPTVQCTGTWRLVDEQPAKPPLTVQEAEKLVVCQKEGHRGDGSAWTRIDPANIWCSVHSWDFHAEDGCGKCHLEAAKATERQGKTEPSRRPCPLCVGCQFYSGHGGPCSVQLSAGYSYTPHPAEPRWPVEALARALFDERLEFEAVCIADPADIETDTPSTANVNRVLGIMWAQTKPAERLDAERMAKCLIDRMKNK